VSNEGAIQPTRCRHAEGITLPRSAETTGGGVVQKPTRGVIAVEQ
jgi:hypothetical protein